MISDVRCGPLEHTQPIEPAQIAIAVIWAWARWTLDNHTSVTIAFDRFLSGALRLQLGFPVL